MTTLFSATDKDQLVERINRLTPDSPHQWGKMNASQMLAHCANAMEVATNEKQIKRTTMGYIFGGFFKKNILQ